jgi:NADH-quinone oxidoreductase subunit L
VPPLSGYFSKDSILLFVAGRGGWHWALWAAGYLGAFLTALYTFRMIFRAFLGDPCPEALELIEHGHLYHPQAPTNPANGEIEDTDVGFPGPDHAIAERAWPMRAAMGTLALLAIIGGIVAIPKSTFWLQHFLAPTFADSTLVGNASNTVLVIGLILGALVSLGGIATAYYVWVLRPGTAPAIAARFSGVATLFENKWYFDELIDALVVRPGAWFGRFAQNSFERVFVNGVLVGGSTGLVRAGSALVRATQSGMLRVYAALMLVGVVGVALYFLLQS